MHISRLLVLPLLISVCAAPVAAQSSSDKNPSQPLSTTPQSAQASIRVDQLQLPFHRDRNDLSHTMPDTLGAGERSYGDHRGKTDDHHARGLSSLARRLVRCRLVPAFA